MPFPERLMPFKPKRVQEKSEINPNSPYEPSFPPVEGKEKERLENQTKELLKENLTP